MASRGSIDIGCDIIDACYITNDDCHCHKACTRLSRSILPNIMLMPVILPIPTMIAIAPRRVQDYLGRFCLISCLRLSWSILPNMILMLVVIPTMIAIATRHVQDYLGQFCLISCFMCVMFDVCDVLCVMFHVCDVSCV